MQQRYYDALVGRFPSRDPVTANAATGANFNAYWYANNNPYRFSDPDGRQACGKNTTCQVAREKGVPYLSGTQMRAIARNPEAYLQRLNNRPNSHKAVAGAARYFAKTAIPVTVATGREVGADIASTLSGEKPYTAVNFALGGPAAGDGSGSYTPDGTYSGPGFRVAVAHTHPVNSPFSGISSSFSNREWSSGMNGTTEGDAATARRLGLPLFLATPDGNVSKFDFPSMHRDVLAHPSGSFSASDYVSTSP